MSLLGSRTIWAALLIGFGALNIWALATDGLDGIATYLTNLGPIGIVATVDLLLALLVGIAFMTRHARQHAVDGRLWVALTLVTGSLGLLAYLARHDVSAAAAREFTSASFPAPSSKY